MRHSANHFIRCICIFAFSVCLLIQEQSYGLAKPRLRISDYFGAPGGIHFVDPDNLGEHCYKNGRGEKKGMVYTRKAGFFDIGHTREAADRTRYAANVAYNCLSKSNRRFQFSMIEPSIYYISIQYPDDWKYLNKDQKEKIAREVSIRLGQYLAHQSLIWHEILTWYGYSSSGIFSENISSFSWEDPYSDVVGTYLAVEALRNKDTDYDDQITRLLKSRLQALDVQPVDVAKKAHNRIKGKWYTGDYYFFVEMKKRSFDVGFDNGQVTPWLVPGMFPDAAPQPCPAPTLDWLGKYGFKFNIQLDPKAAEKSKIYKALDLNSSKDRLRVSVHFPMLVKLIHKEAQNRYGEDVGKPTL